MNKMNKILVVIAVVLGIVALVLVATTIQILIKNSDSTINSNIENQPTEVTNEDIRKENEQTIEADEKLAFRNTYWGMTKDQVKATEEEKPIHETEDLIIYEDTLMGYDVSYAYIFANSNYLLNRSAYTFKIVHTNDNDYINDFEDIKEKVADKYGKPMEDNIIWKTSTFKDYPDNYGMAVGMGHLLYKTVWESEDTNIMLLLQGDNYEITLQLIYWSKEFGNSDQNVDMDKL